jgi:hypothetical protein
VSETSGNRNWAAARKKCRGDASDYKLRKNVTIPDPDALDRMKRRAGKVRRDIDDIEAERRLRRELEF